MAPSHFRTSTAIPLWERARAISGYSHATTLVPRPSCNGETAKPTSPTLEQFLSGLRTAWREGEVRPTSVAKAKPKRSRRRPDPFAAVTVELRGWFEAEPWHTSRELLERLQVQCPGIYPDGQLRTLQRRLKEWRREAAYQMVFGTTQGMAGAGREFLRFEIPV